MKGKKRKLKNAVLFTPTKENVAWFSIASIGILISMKVMASILTGSISIRADALHSTIDFVGAAVALVGQGAVLP